MLSPLFTLWWILYKLSMLSPALLSVSFGNGSISVIKSFFVLLLFCLPGVS